MIEPNRIAKVLRYDGETGKLYWLERDDARKSWNSRYAGREAFTSVDFYGYLQGSIDGRRCLAHRIIMALVYGKWPENDVDHINGNRTDNRFCNLRMVSRSENCMNAGIGVRNKTGVMGVSWAKREKKWKSQIQKDGKNIQIGLFASFDDAVAARKNKEKELGFHCNHGRVK